MRCRWIRTAEVPGGRFHLPECWGAVIYGPDGCTCTSVGAEKRERDMWTEIDELKERLAKLEG